MEVAPEVKVTWSVGRYCPRHSFERWHARDIDIADFRYKFVIYTTD